LLYFCLLFINFEQCIITKKSISSAPQVFNILLDNTDSFIELTFSHFNKLCDFINIESTDNLHYILGISFMNSVFI
jgi:hypothetical protein